MTTAALLSLALFAILVGGLIGCIGIGGVLLVPTLIYLGGIDIRTAIAAAMFSYLLTGLIGAVIFALGFNMERLYHLADPQHSGGHVFNTVSLSVLAALLPNLSMFDLRVQAASPPPYPWDQLWALFGNGALYAVGYLAVLLIAASLSFSTREV